MLSRRVALWGVLGAVLLSMAAIESAPGQGPLRRLLGRGRKSCCPQTSCCEQNHCSTPTCCQSTSQTSCCSSPCGGQCHGKNCCEIYRLESRLCELHYPCDCNSQTNCKTVAMVKYLECQGTHYYGVHPDSGVRPHIVDCQVEYLTAKARCTVNGVVSPECELYAQCVLLTCQHRNQCPNCPHMLQCVAPPSSDPSPPTPPTPPTPEPPPPTSNVQAQ